MIVAKKTVDLRQAICLAGRLPAIFLLVFEGSSLGYLQHQVNQSTEKRVKSYSTFPKAEA